MVYAENVFERKANFDKVVLDMRRCSYSSETLKKVILRCTVK
jgi:hypothetical protein